MSKQHSPNMAACWSAIYDKDMKCRVVAPNTKPSTHTLLKLHDNIYTHNRHDWDGHPEYGRITCAEFMTKYEKRER